FGTDGIVVVSGGGVIKAFAPPQLSSTIIENERPNWRVFPNPATEPPILWVDDAREGAEYTLFDVGGRVITSGPVHQGSNILNWGVAPPGLYHLVIWDGWQRRTAKIMRIQNTY
ncbi:MAG: T9SS type A sorting domain-containing protein, partial [Bacteroidetes bacterium]|nr:T9SS type A sorting domain-containing protein [Bacteroidota bacterium]